MDARLREESGLAMITAIIVSMVVLSLGLTAVAVSFHNSTAGAYDRKRVQAIAAAEAGVNYYFSYLQNQAPEDIECSLSGNLSGSQSSYSITATFYDESLTPMACPLPADKPPAAVLIHSVAVGTSHAPTRAMDAYARLIPISKRKLSNFALFSDNTPGLDSNIVINGYTSDEANVYSNGNVLISSETVVHGDVYAQGNVTMDSNSVANKDIWANGYVQVTEVLGNATSSTSYILGGHIHKNARAGTTITGTVDGLRLPNAPQGPPPPEPFPTLTYTESEWVQGGYVVRNFTDCAAARAFLVPADKTGVPAGSWVVRISPACMLTFQHDDIVLHGNLAIISDGSLDVLANTDISVVGGPWSLFLVFGLSKIAGDCDLVFESNTTIANTGVNTLLYTPCRVEMRSNGQVLEGQIIAGTVTLNSNTTLNYMPMIPPSQRYKGFDEDIGYIREVVN